MKPHSSDLAATVVAVHGQRVLVETGDGALLPAFTRSHRLKPVCGDHVVYSPDGDQAVIERILPRTTTLYRQDGRIGKRPLAANLDTLVVVTAPEPPVSPEQIDRYLIIAEAHSLAALVVHNKTDLLSARQDPLAEFTALGYPCLYTCVPQASGISELAAHLAGQTAVLAGLSGVGKSSISNALIPDLAARTAELSAGSGEGRHTTTTARLYRCPGDAAIIDSPGVRDIRLWPVPAAELAACFVEFRPYLGQCRFNDCRHASEPDCAVRTAVDAGHIGSRRYRSFLDLARRLDS